MIADYYGDIPAMFGFAFFQHWQRGFKLNGQLDHKAVFVDRAGNGTLVNVLLWLHSVILLVFSALVVREFLTVVSNNWECTGIPDYCVCCKQRYALSVSVKIGL